MLLLSTLIGKITFLLLRVLGRKGSALPGLVVEKFDEKFLQHSLNQLPEGFVVVSGTNGKTTTTKIIVELLEAHGMRVVTNPTGSNFVRGIIGALIKSSNLSGHLPYDIAVFEQDEAHAVQLVKRVKPRGVVLLNVMRDQMDRFGEIDTTAKLLGKLAENAKDWVVLNTNDRRIATLRDSAPTKKIWFGHGPALDEQFRDDDQHHSKRGLKHFEAVAPHVQLTAVGDHSITLNVNQHSYSAEVQLGGSHNALNIAAAVAAVQAVRPSAPNDVTMQAVAKIQPAFGRGELIELKSGAQVRLQLVKNPAGFIHALRNVGQQDYVAIGIAINDNDPDGRDVSWLWDVDFSPLHEVPAPIICGGIRANDMAVRLKYDEIGCAHIETGIKQFVDLTLAQSRLGQTTILFCTYTAMLEIRRELKKQALDMKEGL